MSEPSFSPPPKTRFELETRRMYEAIRVSRADGDVNREVTQDEIAAYNNRLIAIAEHNRRQEEMVQKGKEAYVASYSGQSTQSGNVVSLPSANDPPVYNGKKRRNKQHGERQKPIPEMSGVVGGDDRETSSSSSRKASDNDPPVARNPLILPYWDPNTRGIPDSILRSALFGAIKRGPRKHLDNELMYAIGDLTVKYTGKRLDQGDLDIYLGILHCAQHQGTPLGQPVYCTDRQFLQVIGRSTGKSDRDWLRDGRTRLKVNQVEIILGCEKSYGGSLIQNWYRDEGRKMTAVVLDPLLQTLFDPGYWTSVSWEQRSKLKGHPLAQWLHAFYSTHDKPYEYTVGKLHKLCGSECKKLNDFAKELKQALSLIAETSGWKCEVTGTGENARVSIKKI